MLQGIITSALLILVTASSAFTQSVESVSFISGISRAELSGQLGMEVRNGVDFYKMRYNTTGSDGMPDIASGLIVIPRNSAAEQHVVIYHHGTTTSRDRVPSSLNLDYEAYAYFGGNGYLVLAPDYLGLGDSRGFHPYVHKPTLASASVDMLKAFHGWAEQEGILLSENLFLTGYSQVGFAGMATHQKLQEEYNGQFDVTATAHLSGPYSLSGAMRDLMFSEQNYAYIGFVPFAILGFQEVYGDLYETLEDIFRPEYVAPVEAFYQGDLNLVELTILMTIISQQNFGNTHPVNVFNPGLVQAMLTDDEHPLNQILRENDSYHWAPEAPTRLWYCQGDDQVPYQNSIVAMAAMQENGAVDLVAADLNPAFNHSQCAEPAIMAALEFFDSFVPVNIPDHTNEILSLHIYPNPLRDILTISPAGKAGSGTITITDLSGKVVLSTANTYQIDLSGLSSGVYILHLRTPAYSWSHKIFRK